MAFAAGRGYHAMMFQSIIVTAIIVIAAVYVGRAIVKALTASDCATGCGKCASTATEPAVAGRVSLL
jgi:hypothetical protein